ncbi:MAG: DUF2721 domain-containing protein [Planctomycetota bacterium]
MLNSELIPLLQMSIGPVILISGVGLILLSMTNRYGRVIDRSRQLAEAVRNAVEEDMERLSSELSILTLRARLLRTAIAMASFSVLFAAVLILSLFVFGLLKFEGALISAMLFMCCIVSLALALIWFLSDINMSLKALDIETSGTKQRLSQRLSAVVSSRRK